MAACSRWIAGVAALARRYGGENMEERENIEESNSSDEEDNIESLAKAKAADITQQKKTALLSAATKKKARYGARQASDGGVGR